MIYACTPNPPNFIYYRKIGYKVYKLTKLGGWIVKEQARERDVEKYLREKVKKLGGIAYKFESPGNAGVPDRLILLPGGRLHFVELKAPGKKPTPLQMSQHRKIQKVGFEVHVLDSKGAVDDFIAKEAKVNEVRTT